MRNWSLGLLAFGLIIFLSHAGVQLFFDASGTPQPSFAVPRGIMLILLGVVFWASRRHTLRPANPVERMVWAVWIGYLLAHAATKAVFYLQGHSEWDAYPVVAILSGLGFLVMGAHLWGMSYVLGLFFMLSAIWMAVEPRFSALWFGGLWLLALGSFSFRYWRLAKRESEPAARQRDEGISPN